MSCQILFSRKNKKSIFSLSSSEFAHGKVSVNTGESSKVFAGLHL